jgi:hypothetical protein
VLLGFADAHPKPTAVRLKAIRLLGEGGVERSETHHPLGVGVGIGIGIENPVYRMKTGKLFSRKIWANRRLILLAQ